MTVVFFLNKGQIRVLIQTFGTYIHHDGSFFLNIGQIRVSIKILLFPDHGDEIVQAGLGV